ncbi:MAG: type II toxin-antitoxin system Phd/YefM family antitoxin [Oscillospiraceae bacterium]|nr:type II toxin-antitoxin system Phd/YefM family antitoxin [Oscillospiraceae bacterium]
MYEIHKRPSRDLRNNYPEVAELVRAHNDVIITNKGKADVVLINPEDYAEFKEFRHREYVLAALEEAEKYRDKPESWLSEEEFWAGFEE